MFGLPREFFLFYGAAVLCSFAAGILIVIRLKKKFPRREDREAEMIRVADKLTRSRDTEHPGRWVP